MDEDQCNIDDLEALLDDENDEDKCAAPQLKNDSTNIEDGASDDDIDDDELDKLAALVENGLQEHDERVGDQFNTSSGKSDKQKTCTTKTCLNTNMCEGEPTQPNKQFTQKHNVHKQSEQEMQNADILKSELKSLSQVGKEMLEEKSQCLVSVTPSSSEPETAVLAKLNELSAMEEQIRLMKAQLLEKAKHISPEVVETITSPSSSVSKCSPETSTKHKQTPKLKFIEEDLFKPIEQKPALKQTPSKRSSVKTNSESLLTRTLSDTAHDSDSEWDDLDGEKPPSLSKEGKQLKKLLNKGPGDRTAHMPESHSTKYEPAKKPYNSTWKNRPGISPSESTSFYNKTISQTKTSTSSVADNDFINEPLSGIRIINPLVSSATLKSLMSGRKMIHLSRIHTKVKTPDLDSDWVTIGVIVSKSEARKSAKGNQYSIWRLSDLNDCDKVVSLFLFNKVFQELWKTVTGTVIGILNANIMQSTEKSSFHDISITVDNPKKILIIGRCKDLGYCKAKTKAGNDCSNFVNLQKGEYCTYHVQAAYKKCSAKRAEIQAGFTGVVPRSFEKTLFNKGSTVIYGGQTYTTASLSSKASKPKKRSITIQSLQKHHASKPAHEQPKVSTLKLHDLLPEDELALKDMKENKNEKFHEALCVPTVGSLNYVKHMMNCEKIKEKEKSGKSTIISISARELLKSCEKEIKMKREAQKRRLDSKQSNSNAMPEPDVVFDFDAAPVLPPLDLKADIIKQRAIKKVIKKGGIKKEDPNALKKPKSPSDVEKLKKRLNKSPEDQAAGNQIQEPPRKRSKILGNINLESAEIQNLLKARSKHDNNLNEQEQEKQDQYFDVLEKKEQMEEKMSSITEVKCKAFTCKQCKYRAMAPAPHCKEQNHQIIVSDAVKKFFECKDCRQRTITIERYPHQPCRKCQGSSFIRCSMFKEKKGPQLPSENLCLRGAEIKYLNSLN